MPLSPQFIAPALSSAEIQRQQAEKAKSTGISVFKLRGQLLEQGRTDTVLAATDDMTLRLKIYASGGENELHAHKNEDRFFVLLQGSVQFYGSDGELAHLGALEGIMIPKGSYYWFTATSTDPLVMIRGGSPNNSARGLKGRIGSAGTELAGDSKENKTVPIKFKADSFFG